MHRELPTGKGFADTAIQIKQKNYIGKVAEYTGDILLFEITYDDAKGHTCIIERVRK